MDLSPATAEIYVRIAARQMLDVTDRLGDELVNQRPPGPDTNSVAVLIVHCCGVTEYWLGCVGLGRATDRDRDAEFRAQATVAELHTMVAVMVEQTTGDIRALDAGGGGGDPTVREARVSGDPLEGGDHSDAALVLHVLEELFQHLGQMELTADVLL
jgi:phage gp36-like protein